MAANSVAHVGFDLDLDSNSNSNLDGSNAIILIGKKKNKKKGNDKVSKNRKAKEVSQPLSKTKQKKLQKLQEEKEKKLLQLKSIELLEKYKIQEEAHALLQSSGTIGQVVTKKEKRLRAVQLSKVGLEVPKDVLLFKKKRKRDASSDCEAVLDLHSGQSHLETIYHEDLKNVEVCMMSTNKMPQDVGIGSNIITTSIEVMDKDEVTEVMDKDEVTCMLNDQRNVPSLTCSNDRHEAKVQDSGVDFSKAICQDSKSHVDHTMQKHVKIPVVVHVFRPIEVEQKRRDLPIIMMEQEIMEAINEHSIVLLCGETGCGKTTQVPQFLYEAGFGSKSCTDRKGIIGVTQPRRVAVLATAKRVSFELGLRLGREVGFQVRHDKRVGDSCSIKFMTDGILLREVQSDFLLKRYSVIILDEAHERSLNTDILVGMLSRVVKLRQKLYLEQQEKIHAGAVIDPEKMITQLKLVLMSATLRVEDFISERKLFDESPPILEVPVRQFPVTIHFSKKTQEDYLGQAYKKVMSIHKRLPSGGILVFVTGQREVEFLCKKLRKASRQSIENNSRRKAGIETSLQSEVDMKDISEAFEVSSISYQQTNRFSSYEEDDDQPEIDSYSTESGSESEFEVETEDTQGKTDFMRDFLKDSECHSSLKSSFEALAGKPSTQNSNEEPRLPVCPTIEARGSPSTFPGPLYVLPLYAMLPASAHLQVFEEVPEGERLVVIATNVAETSLTIPGIKYVVDSGKEKVKHYNFANGMATYEIQWISKASAAQRAGRAGRTGPGHCYRLYSSAAFGKDDLFPEFSCPEISKTPVDGVVLLMKSMGIDKVANFPFPTPEMTALEEAEHCLKALEALDSQGRTTLMGRAMPQYPMSPRHSRMLLTVIKNMRDQRSYARANLVLGYAIATASALSFSNPFSMHFGSNHDTLDGLAQKEKGSDVTSLIQHEKQRQKKEKAMAREARARFQNPSSDALTYAYALQLFELAANPFEFCQKNSLHLKTMDEMSKLRKQLLQLIFHHGKFCEDFGWDLGSAEDVEHSWRVNSSSPPLRINEEEILCQAISAGWADRAAKRIRKVSNPSENDKKLCAVRYPSCALNDIVYLHRWSSVSRSAPEFVVYTELFQTNKPYMHGATAVKPDWLVKYASSLCSFSAPLTNPKPYYEPVNDQVLCWVSPIFGRYNWQLPLHSLPIKSHVLRLSVFACALLEGRVLPCMRSAQKLLVMPPSSLLRPEALGQRRVGDLLNGLKVGSRRIDSRAALREVWDENPRVLYLDIQHWFQERFYDLFEDLWEQMHREVLLEDHELFPKKATKERSGKIISIYP